VAAGFVNPRELLASPVIPASSKMVPKIIIAIKREATFTAFAPVVVWQAYLDFTPRSIQALNPT
jgi:hypothetical protein